jgi:hypothetical protein
VFASGHHKKVVMEAAVGGSRAVRPETPQWLDPRRASQHLPAIYKQALICTTHSTRRVDC